MTTSPTSHIPMAVPPWPRPAWAGALPPHVQSLLEDVYSLVDKGQSALAMAGLRILVEQVVRDGVGSSGNMRARLDQLHTRGFISTHDRGRLEAVVDHGNMAVHQGVSVGGEELRHLLMCVEHVLLGHFVLRRPPPQLPSAGKS